MSAWMRLRRVNKPQGRQWQTMNNGTRKAVATTGWTGLAALGGAGMPECSDAFGSRMTGKRADKMQVYATPNGKRGRWSGHGKTLAEF